MGAALGLDQLYLATGVAMRGLPWCASRSNGMRPTREHDRDLPFPKEVHGGSTAATHVAVGRIANVGCGQESGRTSRPGVKI
jgi:hypothetical protein